MNGFTFIALIILCYFIIKIAMIAINTAALYIARWQGEQKALEDIKTWDRLNKRGEWNVNEGWKP